ncbi:hypothetical protein ACFVZ3_40420 [Kitasatospora purpeofusca]|uniref:hypothetical protein n=1 Tax=Kitasatospora purpeofusca TaxID=67352 RepID=UPI00368ADED8
MQNQIALDIDRYVRARVVADIWLDLLRRALQDVMAHRLDLARFDTESTEHSKELRLRTAELTHIGIATVRSGALFNLLRNATAMIKEVHALPGEERQQHEMGLAGSITMCQVERGRWAELMIDHIRSRTGWNLTMMES